MIIFNLKRSIPLEQVWTTTLLYRNERFLQVWRIRCKSGSMTNASLWIEIDMPLRYIRKRHIKWSIALPAFLKQQGFFPFGTLNICVTNGWNVFIWCLRISLSFKHFWLCMNTFRCLIAPISILRIWCLTCPLCEKVNKHHFVSSCLLS